MSDVRWIVVLAATGLLAGCGGGGGGSGPLGNGGGGGSGGTVGYTPGVYQPSSSLAGQCIAPRAGSGESQGSAATENNFLRSWNNELYLWYREVPDINPNASDDPLDFFDRLKTNETTASGRDKDRFHFTFDTDDWIALSQSGIEPGYGAQWIILSGQPPRRLVVAFVEPGSPAATQNLSRGVEVLQVDGADLVNGGTQAIVDRLNAGLFPLAAGESHSFRIKELNGTERDVTMTSANVTYTPVRNVTALNTASGPVGYILFNDHIATSEQGLINAVNQLHAQNVTDLVLDLRYNGGGFLDIASELAYMIAGGTMTSGRTFERLLFNDKHPSTNPVTGQPLTPTPFHTTTQIASQGQPLPTLDLNRVYVITGPSTCSASESIINSLRGVDVEVFMVGGSTCGKPYGFYPEDNCGTTYFSIQFQGLNDKGFGDYSDGFKAANSAVAGAVPVPGCSVADDFSHQLGDPAEARLAAALAFRAGNNQSTACPTPSSVLPGDAVSKASAPLSAIDGVMVRSPFRENRIMRKPCPDCVSF
jgi:hypothetical protein